MAEADAEDGDAAGGGGDEVEADAGLVRRAGAGREHDRLGLHGQNLRHRYGIVTPDLAAGAEIAEELHEVEGKAVVVVDEQYHANIILCHGGRVNQMAGAAGLMEFAAWLRDWGRRSPRKGHEMDIDTAAKTYPVSYTDAEWRARLTAEQYRGPASSRDGAARQLRAAAREAARHLLLRGMRQPPFRGADEVRER